MMLYLIKANVLLALCYAGYACLARRDTFLGCHRAYLLASLLLPFALPLLAQSALGVPLFAWTASADGAAREAAWQLPAFVVAAGGAEAAGPLARAAAIVLGVWATGAALLSARVAGQLISLARTARRCRRTRTGGVAVRLLPAGSAPFSFFRLIFLPTDAVTAESAADILTHERVHARQWHSVDVMLAELVCACCWFNPFAWLLRRELRANLEYLADRGVLAAGYGRRSYQYHLLGQTYPKAAAHLYNYSHVLLKKRIQMMNKPRSQSAWRAKYLLSLPLVCLLAAVGTVRAADAGALLPAVAAGQARDIAARDSVTVEDLEKKIYDQVEVKPEFPGGQMALYQFLAKNIQYPASAMESEEQGRVIVTFVIDRDGNVTDAKVKRSVSKELDQEALRVVRSMPKWKPGRQDGKAVNTQFTLPVTFKLQ